MFTMVAPRAAAFLAAPVGPRRCRAPPPHFTSAVRLARLLCQPVRRASLRAPHCCAAPSGERGAADRPPAPTGDAGGSSGPAAESAAGPVDIAGSEGSAGRGGAGASGGGGGSAGDARDGGGRGEQTYPALLAESRRLADKLLLRVGEGVAVLFRFVPPQVLTALIGLASGWAAQRRSNEAKRREAERSAAAAARQARAAQERHLAELYDDNHGPLLKAACKLSERFFTLVTGFSSWEEDKEPYNGTMYTAFLLARYLAFVEHIKRSSRDTLDLGYPAADRIFLNILGRIQSTLAASDEVLFHLQGTEAAFKPAPGGEKYSGGPFAVTPRSQVAIGELMCRRSGRSGTADVLSFSEFVTKLNQDRELQLWIRPVLRDLDALRRAARAANMKTRGRQRQPKHTTVRTLKEHAASILGARPFFVQNALQDLIDFLDPTPFKIVRPDYRRRLTLGHEHYSEQLRMPSALFALYQDLASIRDHVVSRDDPMRPFRGKPVEVFIKAVSASGPRGLRAGNYEMGDCPYSQRVLIAMEELGIPHRIVPIDTHHKPGWFHLMSGESLVPVIFTDGTLVSGSRHIMSYLIDKYPRRAQGALGPSCVGGLRVGTMAYTRFYPLFQSALRGAPGAVTALQDELKELNATMMAIQAKPGREGVLLGGRTFSREDTSIAPLLHALDVAGPALKEGCGIPDGCDALKEYLAASRSIPSFAKCVPRNEVTIDGYRALLGTKTRAAPCRPWMSDMLE